MKQQIGQRISKMLEMGLGYASGRNVPTKRRIRRDLAALYRLCEELGDDDVMNIIDVTKPKLERELAHKLAQSVSELNISDRSKEFLHKGNIDYVCELVQRTEADLLKMKWIGRKLMKEIKDTLAVMGLSLGQKLDAEELKIIGVEIDRIDLEKEQATIDANK